MKHSKLLRIWISLMASALLLTSLAGCQQGNDSSNSLPESSGAAAGNTPGYTLPIAPEGTTLSIAVPENGYAPASYANNLAVFEEFERRTGVKLDWQVYPGSEFVQAMTTRLAAGTDLPDMFKVPGDDNTLVKLAQDGIVAPLDEAIGQYGVNIQKLYDSYPDMKTGTTLSDGHIYSLPYSYYEQRYLKVPVIAIRGDWLEKLSLEVPKTLEDWTEVLQAFHDKDPNGNGEADEIAIAAFSLQNTDGGGLGVFANAWGLRYGASSLGKMIDENNKVSYSQITPEFKEYLSWMNSLYAEGLIHPDVTPDAQTVDQLIAGDRVGVYVNMVGSIPTKNASVQRADGGKGGYIPVMPPENINTGEQYLEIQNGILFHFAVSKDCTQVDTAVKWLDYFYASDEGRRLAHWGIEGETYELKDGRPQLTPLVTENPDGLDVLSMQRSYGCFNNFLMFRDLEFMKAVSKPVEVEFSEQNQERFVEPFPTVISTADEARRLASLLADITPYEEEMVTKFIMGLEPLSEYDSYLETMKGLGIEEVIAIWQQQVDRAQGNA